MAAGCQPGVEKETSGGTKKTCPLKDRSEQSIPVVPPYMDQRTRILSHESANTLSALNASTRSGYSGFCPFPLSLSDPFAGEPSAGFQHSPALCRRPFRFDLRFKGFFIHWHFIILQFICQPVRLYIYCFLAAAQPRRDIYLVRGASPSRADSSKSSIWVTNHIQRSARVFRSRHFFLFLQNRSEKQYNESSLSRSRSVPRPEGGRGAVPESDKVHQKEDIRHVE